MTISATAAPPRTARAIDLAHLRDERLPGADPLDRHRVDERQRRRDVDERDADQPEPQRARQRARRIAHLAGDLGHFPPAAEEKKARDECARQRARERRRAGRRSTNGTK